MQLAALFCCARGSRAWNPIFPAYTDTNAPDPIASVFRPAPFAALRLLPCSSDLRRQGGEALGWFVYGLTTGSKGQKSESEKPKGFCSGF